MIEVKNLVKKFDSFKAVDNISFDVEEGEIFGLLGPNGAGKTTTIRMITSVLEPSAGNIRVSGHNVQENPMETKQLMGIVPEMANAYADLSAMRNLLLIGELYGIGKKKRVEKAEELLKLFKLYDRKDQKVKKFSKGMEQRVILAMALMNDADILFLDEPTTGLDVESTRLIRGLIKKFNNQGTTIFLTTHDIKEANNLCDRVAIMNYGKIVAIDQPEKLKRTIKSTSSVEVAFENPVKPENLNFEPVVEAKKEGDKFKLYTENPEQVIPLVVEHSKKSNNEIISLNTLGPSLEDVFVKLTEK